MRTILSYPIELQPPVSELWATATVELPAFANILRVGLLGHEPVMWALGNPDHSRETRTFVAISEGDRLPDLAGAHNYVGGWVDKAWSFHLFEVR